MKILKSDGTVFYTREGKPYIGLFTVDADSNIAYKYVDNRPDYKGERLFTRSVLDTEIVRTKLKNPAFSLAPKPYKPAPTDYDYANGFVNRYFVQKRNTPAFSIIEVSEQTYSKVVQSANPLAIDGTLYNKVKLEWRIAGKREYVKQVNKTAIDRAQAVLPGIALKLRKLDEFLKL